MKKDQTSHFSKNKKDTWGLKNYFELFTLSYKDGILEKNYIQFKHNKSKLPVKVFSIITFLYALLNMFIFFLKTQNIADSYSIVSFYIFSLISLTLFISSCCIKNVTFVNILLYLQSIQFSLNHFQLCNWVKIINNIDILKEGFLICLISIFLNTDLIYLIVFSFTILNNFLFSFISTCIKLLLIMVFFQINTYYSWKYIFYILAPYIILNFLYIVISRNNEIKQKLIFILNFQNSESKANLSNEEIKEKSEKLEIILDKLNSGYLKLNTFSNFSAQNCKNFEISSYNNFFNKLDFEIPIEDFHLKNEDLYQYNHNLSGEYDPYIKEKIILDKILNSLLEKEKYILNKEDYDYAYQYKYCRTNSVNLKNPEHEETHKIIDFNTNLESLVSYNTKSNKKLLDKFDGESYSSNSKFNSPIILLNKNKNLIRKSFTLSQKNLNSFKKNNSNQINDTEFLILPKILRYISLNSSKFSLNFECLGKANLIYNNDILSLQILVKYSQNPSTLSEEIEFIFNDITKQELKSNNTQFLLKTSQYFHDFKNPLICIQNEVSELKEECELLLTLLCKHNEEIDKMNQNKTNHNIRKIEIEDEDCISLLDKFEYTKKMSEYCQMMIGSYEDLSKSLLNCKVNLIIDKFDLSLLLNFIEEMMNFQISNSKKNVEFILKQEINFTQNEVYLYSDESKLKRVLINLLSNSLKFTSTGSITLTVDTEMIESRKYYKFSIEDTGTGMSKKSLEQIFTPFYSNNTECNKNGVGLGLITVKEFTEKLGTSIKINSILGRGTTMSFHVEDKEDSFQNTINKFTETPYEEITDTKIKNLNQDQDKYKNEDENIGIKTNREILEILDELPDSSCDDSFSKENSNQSINNRICLDSKLSTNNSVLSSELDAIEKQEKINKIKSSNNNIKVSVKKYNDELLGNCLLTNTDCNETEVLGTRKLNCPLNIEVDNHGLKFFDQFNLSSSNGNLSNSCSLEVGEIKIFNDLNNNLLGDLKSEQSFTRNLQTKNFTNFTKNLSNSIITNNEFYGKGFSNMGLTGNNRVLSKCSTPSSITFSQYNNYFFNNQTFGFANVIKETPKLEDCLSPAIPTDKPEIYNLMPVNNFVFNKASSEKNPNSEILLENPNSECKSDLGNILKRKFTRKNERANTNSKHMPVIKKKISSVNLIRQRTSFSNLKFKTNLFLSKLSEKNNQYNKNDLIIKYENSFTVSSTHVRSPLSTPKLVQRLIEKKTTKSSFLNSCKDLNKLHSDKEILGSLAPLNFCILIIDDDKPIRSFCKNLLSKIEEQVLFKFEIEEAEDGSIGLMKIFQKFLNNNRGYDLIITDDSMTLLDGSNMVRTLFFLNANKYLKLENFYCENMTKIIINSSDPENVKKKITEPDILKDIIICEKPLKIEILKNFIKF